MPLPRLEHSLSLHVLGTRLVDEEISAILVIDEITVKIRAITENILKMPYMFPEE